MKPKKARFEEQSSQGECVSSLHSYQQQESNTMASTAFERPIGAKADATELEYVATLHQTAFPTRPDCSIIGE